MKRIFYCFVILLAIACTQEPKQIPVTGITLSQTSIEVTEGESTRISATVSPSNATNKVVIWSSNNPYVLVSDGTISGLQPCTATVTAKTDDGGKTATCAVTVKAKTVVVTRVTLDKSTLKLEEGETATLIATVEPENATNKAVTWSSTDESVASVANGTVTAKKAGTATITVKTDDGDKTATCVVTVNGKAIAVTFVSLDKSTLKLEEGETATLIATVEPENATNKAVTWSSTDESVASVVNGTVTAKKAGKATVTVQTEDGAKKAACIVTVVAKIIPVTGVTIDRERVEMLEGESVKLVATILPGNATNKDISWNSSNNSVASVSDGNVTANKAGSATITAKTVEGSFTAICQITVKHDSQNDPISFADALIKEKLVAAFDKNGDGEISYGEAAAVTSIQDVFGSLKAYTSFDEFQHFTSVKKIPKNCFENSLLTSIVMPESLVTIENNAFSGCARLAKADLNDKLESISYNVFSDCVSLLSVDLPASLKTLGSSAFNGCTNLTTIIIPEKVRTIDNQTFYKCEQLSSVVLPNGLEAIKSSAFEDCKSLTSISFPEGLRSLGSYSFNETGLTKVVVPNSVESLDMGVFSSCFNLTEITLPQNITVIPSSFLERCRSLTSINIPSSVMSIAKYAFQHTGLTSVVIPQNVTKIGYGAFSNCSSMKSVTLMPTFVPQGDSEMFSGIGLYSDMNYPIYVPSESLDAYKTAQYWKTYADRIFPIDDHISVTGVSLNKSEIEMAVGAKVSLQAIVSPSDAIDKTVVWSSTDETVATVSPGSVNSLGTVTAVKVGTAIIRVTTNDGGKTAECRVVVKDDDGHVESVSLNRSSAKLMPGEQMTLTATITPATATNKNVSWVSSNASVVTVADGVVYAVAEGSASITATTEDGGKTATCQVTVTNDISQFVSASYNGGAMSIINGTIQSGSQLNFSVNNNTQSNSIVVKSVQLTDTSTGVSTNVMTINAEITAGSSKGWTITLGRSMQMPVAKFIYTYNGVDYETSAAYYSMGHAYAPLKVYNTIVLK